MTILKEEPKQLKFLNCRSKTHSKAVFAVLLHHMSVSNLTWVSNCNWYWEHTFFY